MPIRWQRAVEVGALFTASIIALAAAILLGGGWNFLLLLIPLVVIAFRVYVLIANRNKELYQTRVLSFSSNLLRVDSEVWSRTQKKYAWLDVNTTVSDRLKVKVQVDKLPESMAAHLSNLNATVIHLMFYPGGLKFNWHGSANLMHVSMLSTRELKSLSYLLDELLAATRAQR